MRDQEKMTCKILEEMCIQERNKAVMEIAIRMIKAGRYALEEIVNISGLSPDEVKKLQVEQSV